MSKKRASATNSSLPPKKPVRATRRSTPEDDPDCYRVTMRGPLKEALENVFSMLQESRKYRRLASSSVHELAKEAMDIGLQHIESELEEEQHNQK